MNVELLSWVAGALAEAGLAVSDGLGDRGRRTWAGAAIDSRVECSGRLFFALRGERTDGHFFVRDAYRAGCSAVVIEDAELSRALKAEKIPFLLVSDCLKALQELATSFRRHLNVRVVAVTGSAGKTSTKEQIREVLKSKFRVFGSPGNYNNLIGVPLTILETENEIEYLVCEVGANQLGEIDFLSEMLAPDIGVITNIGDAHVGIFGSVENIVRAKGELLDHLSASGCAVLPRDDDYFARLRERAATKVITFGFSAEADYVITDLKVSRDGLNFAVNGEPVALGVLGDYYATNACAAYAVGEFCGVAPQGIRAALAGITPMPGRGRIHRAGGVTLVDESYNASPSAMRASLSALERVEAGRRVAVLGDMKELGDYSDAKHEELGELIAGKSIDRVFWVGPEGSRVEHGFRKRGGRAPFEVCADVESLISRVEVEIGAGDLILVKASRACGLDRFVALLLEKLGKPTEN